MKLHYRGDCTDFDPDRVLGPDRYGAAYVITGAEFDGERTTATLRVVPPAEREERAQEFMARYGERAKARQRISTLFGGAA